MAQQSIRGGVACCGVEAEYLALAFLSDREGAGWLSACRMSNPARTGVTSAGVLVVATVIALAPRGARGAVVMGAAPGMWGCMAARSSATSSTAAASVGDGTGGGRLHWHIPLVPFNCAAVTYSTEAVSGRRVQTARFNGGTSQEDSVVLITPISSKSPYVHI